MDIKTLDAIEARAKSARIRPWPLVSFQSDDVLYLVAEVRRLRAAIELELDDEGATRWTRHDRLMAALKGTT